MSNHLWDSQSNNRSSEELDVECNELFLFRNSKTDEGLKWFGIFGMVAGGKDDAYESPTVMNWKLSIRSHCF